MRHRLVIFLILLTTTICMCGCTVEKPKPEAQPQAEVGKKELVLAIGGEPEEPVLTQQRGGGDTIRHCSKAHYLNVTAF